MQFRTLPGPWRKLLLAVILRSSNPTGGCVGTPPIDGTCGITCWMNARCVFESQTAQTHYCLMVVAGTVLVR